MASLWAAGDDLLVVEVIPTADTSAYASGDLIGEKLTLSRATNKISGGGGLIQSVLLVDQAAQEAAIDVVFFHSDPTGTTFTDNAALDIADADMDKIAGVVSLTTYVSFADNSISQKGNLALPFVLAGDRDLYAALVSRGTPTYVAATDLVLRVNIIPF